MNAPADTDEVNQQRREEAADADRAEQDALQHAEPRARTSSGTVRCMIVSALMSTSELPSPINASATSATGTDGDPEQREWEAVQRDPDPEIGGQPAARREDQSNKATDEAADSERGIKVTDRELRRRRAVEAR